tara:strand:+ start:89 stop:748 length:660 start_codon:yes stop_codon:yes gene_type:complete
MTLKMLHFTLFYLILIKSTQKYPSLKIWSIVHAFISVAWLFYIFRQKIGLSFIDMFSYKTIQNISDKISNDVKLKEILYDPGYHSIGYFTADFIYGVCVKKYTYLLHHIISILMLGNVYLGSSLSVTGLFYAEIGGIMHHLQRFEKYSRNRYLTKLLLIMYFFIYGYTRIILLGNNFNCFKYSKSLIEKTQIFLFMPIFFQNMNWLWENWNLSKHKILN